MIDFIYNKISSIPFLKNNDVHIYTIKTNNLKDDTILLKNKFPKEDLEIANKYIFEKDRIRYLISRVILREILSVYLSIDSERIKFSYNEYGKPFIKNKKTKIKFNISHSEDILVLGVTKNKEIGVDIEKIHEIELIDNIIHKFFSNHEKADFAKIYSAEKLKAFFTCWTRKEAYIKALGLGLAYPLNEFSVSVFPGKTAELIHDENYDALRWSLKDILLTDEYVGAVVVEGRYIESSLYKVSI